MPGIETVGGLMPQQNNAQGMPTINQGVRSQPMNGNMQDANYEAVTGEPMQSGDQIKQQIQQMISQMPQEAIMKIVQMSPEDAIGMLYKQFADQGLDMSMSLNLAGLLYEEIGTFAQVNNNATLGMLNPKIMDDMNPENIQDQGGSPGGENQLPSLMG